MRIHDLFEDLSHYYSAIMLSDYDTMDVYSKMDTWDAEVQQANKTFKDILSKYGFRLLDDADNVLITDWSARTERTQRLRSLVVRIVNAWNEIHDNLGWSVYISLLKDGDEIISGDIEQMRRFIYNHGSIEDDLF